MRAGDPWRWQTGIPQPQGRTRFADGINHFPRLLSVVCSICAVVFVHTDLAV